MASAATLVGATFASAAPVTAGSESLRTGWYPDEGQLTPRLLEEGRFDRLFDTPVQGQVYAQPLVSGNTLLAATEDDWVYGIDPQTGEVRWERQVEAPWREEKCSAPAPNVGITGTPVIDPETNVAYFVSKGYESGGEGTAAFRMHAVDLTTGEEEPNFPVEISGEAENLATSLQFDPHEELQRPALLLMGGVVYAAFGSLCDNSPFNGWVVGVSTGGQVKAMWATSPHGVSIWQGGGGLVSDGEGQILLTTGNSESHEFGTGSPPGPGPGDEPPEELGESVVRLEVQPGGGLEATDFFSPSDNVFLDEEDFDFGSGAPLALPSAYFGTESVPNLMVELGKQGTLYLLNRDELGGMDQGFGAGWGPEGKDDVVQEITGIGGVWGSLATWPGDGGYVYAPSTGGDEIEGTVGSFEVFAYGTEGNQPRLSLVAEAPEALGYGSGSPIVTSNGTESGSAIVWQPTCNHPFGCEGSTLDAYAAVPEGGTPRLLWSGEIGVASKFARPEVSEGRVFVGALDGHVVGFGPIASPPSPSPSPSPQPVVNPPSEPEATRPGTRIAKVRIWSGKGKAKIFFRGVGTTEYLQCRLLRPRTAKTHRKVPGFSRCRSPKTYAHLATGAYTFQVRAVNASGPDKTPAKKKFRIKRRSGR